MSIVRKTQVRPILRKIKAFTTSLTPRNIKHACVRCNCKFSLGFLKNAYNIMQPRPPPSKIKKGSHLTGVSLGVREIGVG